MMGEEAVYVTAGPELSGSALAWQVKGLSSPASILSPKPLRFGASTELERAAAFLQPNPTHVYAEISPLNSVKLNFQ